MEFHSRVLQRISWFVVLIVLCVSCSAKELPSSFQLCHRKDPKFDSCVGNAITGALRLMKDGVPEFGILPIDPLVVNSLSIQQGSSSPINLKQDFKNVKLINLSNSVVTRSKSDLKNFRMRSEAVTPVLQFVGDYTMEGRILVLPVSGRGFSNVTIHGMKSIHELIGEPVEKNGEIYFRVKKYIVKLENPKFMTLHFENLFNGDRTLGNAMNQLINDNWQLMFSELRGAYEDTFGYIFKEITNKLFSRVPMRKIFLED